MKKSKWFGTKTADVVAMSYEREGIQFIVSAASVVELNKVAKILNLTVDQKYFQVVEITKAGRKAG